MTDEFKPMLLAILKSLGANLTLSDYENLPLTDLGLDSLKTMDLVLNIEESFDIQIPDEKLNSKYLVSVNSLLQLILACKRD